MDDKELSHMAASVGDRLLDRNFTLATAESCTGGWIAKVVTDVIGSSAWFDRGFVTYSNEAKQEMLGVSADTLKTWGAVSEAVVCEMALGAISNSGADVSVAVSGIAGPGGGSPEKPVDTVWLAWADREGNVRSAHTIFSGNRDEVRRQAVMAALDGIE